MDKLISIALFFALSTTTACITDETDTVDEQTGVRQDPNAPENDNDLPEGCRPLKNGDLDCDIPEE